MVNLPDILQTILTIFGIVGIVGVAFTYGKSRYTQGLVTDLKTAYEVHEKQIKDLTEKVETLEKENEILKKIPLEKIMEHLEQVVKTQNEILARLPITASPTIVNVDKK